MRLILPVIFLITQMACVEESGEPEGDLGDGWIVEEVGLRSDKRSLVDQGTSAEDGLSFDSGSQADEQVLLDHPPMSDDQGPEIDALISEGDAASLEERGSLGDVGSSICPEPLDFLSEARNLVSGIWNHMEIRGGTSDWRAPAEVQAQSSSSE